MVRPLLLPRINGDNLSTSMPLAIGLFLSIIALIATLCAKHAKKNSKKSISSSHAKSKTKNNNNESKILPRLSPLLKIPNKTKKVVDDEEEESGDPTGKVAGEEGLWQKAIIMGEKCQPPEFSGVIYYDPSGNRVSELPRSPRASPLSRYAC